MQYYVYKRIQRNQLPVVECVCCYCHFVHFPVFAPGITFQNNKHIIIKYD